MYMAVIVKISIFSLFFSFFISLKSDIKMGNSPGCLGRWVGGWKDVKASLRIAYRNQKRK